MSFTHSEEWYHSSKIRRAMQYETVNSGLSNALSIGFDIDLQDMQREVLFCNLWETVNMKSRSLCPQCS